MVEAGFVAAEVEVAVEEAVGDAGFVVAVAGAEVMVAGADCLVEVVVVVVVAFVETTGSPVVAVVAVCTGLVTAGGGSSAGGGIGCGSGRAAPESPMQRNTVRNSIDRRTIRKRNPVRDIRE